MGSWGTVGMIASIPKLNFGSNPPNLSRPRRFGKRLRNETPTLPARKCFGGLTCIMTLTTPLHRAPTTLLTDEKSPIAIHTQLPFVMNLRRASAPFHCLASGDLTQILNRHNGSLKLPCG